LIAGYATLIDFDTQREFFIGVDSDGCVFDSMELKHKECFCPAVVKHWGLQGISKYVRQVWDYVNLYSATRGYNRFLALIELFAHLQRRADLQGREISWPDLTALVEWTHTESKLGNATLEAYLKTHPDGALQTALEWSLDVNETIEAMITLLPPFPYAKDSLAKAAVSADILVVSQTPLEALQREWRENGLDGYVRFIAGQEHGTKAEHIQQAAVGRYETDKILMIGDAPGDLKAAQANNALFFPIVPGHEEGSWAVFYETALDKFFNGRYTREYESGLIAAFNRGLSDRPAWECLQPAGVSAPLAECLTEKPVNH
jgi:phosphoglycolate phosphatase-like HAD superfamily hydrolase